MGSACLMELQSNASWGICLCDVSNSLQIYSKDETWKGL